MKIYLQESNQRDLHKNEAQEGMLALFLEPREVS